MDQGTQDQQSGTQGDRSAVQEKAQEAREQVSSAVESARGRLQEQVDQRSTDAGERLGRQANDLRSLGQELRVKGKDGPARMAEQVADRTERAATWLRDSDGERLLSDVEAAGRRNPWAVIAGGMLLGFAASRMLKASSTDRYRRLGDQWQASSGAQPTRVRASLTMPQPGAGTTAGTTANVP